MLGNGNAEVREKVERVVREETHRGTASRAQGVARHAGDKVVGGNYSAPSTNLQLLEGRQVHECVAGDAADEIEF